MPLICLCEFVSHDEGRFVSTFIINVKFTPTNQRQIGNEHDVDNNDTKSNIRDDRANLIINDYTDMAHPPLSTLTLSRIQNIKGSQAF